MGDTLEYSIKHYLREYTQWTPMEKENTFRKSRFSAAVKVDKKQLIWLKEHKDCRTVAGFLDKIINRYKNECNETTTTDQGWSNLQ